MRSLLWFLFLIAPVTGRTPSIFASPQQSRRLSSSPFDNTLEETDANTLSPAVSNNRDGHIANFLQIRGGATARKGKGRKGGRTASLSSTSTSSKKKTVTGKNKVTGTKKEEPKPQNAALKWYKSLLPLTKVYITSVGLCTLVGLVLGEEMAQGLLALDPMRVVYGLEIWRVFTAASFLGPLSISWLMSGYYLYEYGSSLEKAYGTAQFSVFLFSQLVLLSLLSGLCGFPFFGQSMITAMLHVLSRAMPNQKVKWLIFTVPYWALPYGLMATDVLQSQKPDAAFPHIIGILAGHFYHFHKNVWPKSGGQDWLSAPDFLSQALDPNARKSASKDSLNKALKSRKKSKGRKLGSA